VRLVALDDVLDRRLGVRPVARPPHAIAPRRHHRDGASHRRELQKSNVRGTRHDNKGGVGGGGDAYLAHPALEV